MCMYTRTQDVWDTCACAFRKIVAPVTPTLGYRLTVTDPPDPYSVRVSIATSSVLDLPSPPFEHSFLFQFTIFLNPSLLVCCIQDIFTVTTLKKYIINSNKYLVETAN